MLSPTGRGRGSNRGSVRRRTLPKPSQHRGPVPTVQQRHFMTVGGPAPTSSHKAGVWPSPCRARKPSFPGNSPCGQGWGPRLVDHEAHVVRGQSPRIGMQLRLTVVESEEAAILGAQAQPRAEQRPESVGPHSRLPSLTPRATAPLPPAHPAAASCPPCEARWFSFYVDRVRKMLFHTIFQQKCLFFSCIYSLLGILCHWPCVYKAGRQHSQGCSGLQGTGGASRHKTQQETQGHLAEKGATRAAGRRGCTASPQVNSH